VGDRLILPAPTNMPPTQAAATANDLAILNNIRESQVMASRDVILSKRINGDVVIIYLNATRLKLWWFV
jgi:hypothetical protein